MLNRRVTLRKRWKSALFWHIPFWPKTWPGREWLQNSSHLILTFLEKKQTPLVCQAPYSPEMAPDDFWLLPNSRGHRKENSLSFSWQWKSGESTKHYLTQMLLAINWRYWQVRKDSRMFRKVEGHLMQVCFIEIHPVFERYFCNRACIQQIFTYWCEAGKHVVIHWWHCHLENRIQNFDL